MTGPEPGDFVLLTYGKVGTVVQERGILFIKPIGDESREPFGSWNSWLPSEQARALLESFRDCVRQEANGSVVDAPAEERDQFENWLRGSDMTTDWLPEWPPLVASFRAYVTEALQLPSQAMLYYMVFRKVFPS